MKRVNPEAWGYVRDRKLRDDLQAVLERAQLAHVRVYEARLRGEHGERRRWEDKLKQAERDLTQAEKTHGEAWPMRLHNTNHTNVDRVGFDAHVSAAKKNLAEARARKREGKRDAALTAARLALYQSEKAFRRFGPRVNDPMRVATADQLRWEATKEIADLSKSRNPGTMYHRKRGEQEYVILAKEDRPQYAKDMKRAKALASKMTKEELAKFLQGEGKHVRGSETASHLRSWAIMVQMQKDWPMEHGGREPEFAAAVTDIPRSQIESMERAAPRARNTRRLANHLRR